ncbi:WW domain-binding protein 4 isoform X4 [Pseudophryne corroboree]|uniref:WW domain-binding protein 4 isoform X4 n=1 Tax=Pseudophryne corroboree TaxID=495146 RepID=UPI0030821F89
MFQVLHKLQPPRILSLVKILRNNLFCSTGLQLLFIIIITQRTRGHSLRLDERRFRTIRRKGFFTSIEFHERGKNHKENVTKKISEIKQKSVAKAKDEERKSKEFAAMEEAALKAYEEDLKRLEGTKPVPAAPVGPTIEERRARDEKKRNEIEALEKHHAEKKWKKGMSPEGYPYYYNLTGESSWEKPKGFLETTDHAEGQGTSSVWVESVSEEGYTYYYNSDTGESRWDKPEDLDSNLPPSDEKKDIAATEDNSVDSEKEIVTSELETKTTPEETEPADGATQSPTVTLKTKSNFRAVNVKAAVLL